MDLSALLSGAANPPVHGTEKRRILTAARTEFISHGFRRASVGNIAKLAGVSRPTVYRHCGDKEAIFQAVVFDEVVEFFTGIATEILGLPTPAERAVEGFVLGVRGTRANQLFTAIRNFEPEAFTNVFLDPDPANRDFICSAIAMGLATETLSYDRALGIAEIMTRVTASLLVAPTEHVSIETDDAAREVATRYFVPIITSALD
ncbi:TetR/AcrR family transcriptional regulator [Nocardia sp. NPDC051030]|uniref:TetR/AcrR family transcriptional regulator n=1 Tax=Nocardia sp. NPDC051030 TaxID=3155162 RepID=UPI00342414F8